ncbi:MAG: ThuA domain-containing protein [Pirellulaceae bacterium]
MNPNRGVYLVVAIIGLWGFAEADLSALSAAEKIKVLIVTGFDAGSHKWKETTAQTVATLEATQRFDVKVSESVDVFASDLPGTYQVVVLNYGFWQAPDPSGEAKAGLLKYVLSGGGIVALHFACSSFQNWAEYRELLGRVWVNGVGGHGPRGKFDVHVQAADHPITSGLKDFQADDELYAKLTGEVPIDVLATADSDWSGKTEPIVFTKMYGQGRVVQNVLGHDTVARDNPSFKELLCRGVEWAATGQVAP